MEDNARLRRKDTTKGPPLRILSLDGGGVRGYSMLIILQELMHRTFVEIEGRAPKRHEIPKPADHFDLIAGTGTGGLIAIMLGRLRLDIDTCKDLYVRLTRRVFETDKTIAGIPYKSTLFKASKLEEAIREVVREHTLHGSEGNDTVSQAGMTPDSPRSQMSGGAESSVPSRTMSQASRYSQVGLSPVNPPRNFGVTGRWGNANALLYDAREARTKTAVTAMFAGKRSTGSSVMLRSYDSRKEPASDVNCTIWQAGRATSATGLAFKPIQIGQTTYHDEGSGKYNPAPQVLDEAVLNEWPGREVGVFVSIGTGKRPSGTSEKQHEWWEGFMGGTLGNFAEARRRLIAKIEGCEDTHQYMMHEHLGARHVSPENYYRLNVEVGVGEFGMNEWDRLGDISTGTRMYLGKSDVQSINLGASAKLARVHFAKKRLERTARGQNGPGSLSGRHSWQNGYDQPSPSSQEIPLPSNPMAVELPGSDPSFLPAAPPPRPSYEHRPSVADMKYTVVSSDEFPQPADDPHNTSDATTPTQQSYAHSHHRSYSHNYHSHNPSSATSLHSPYQSPTYPPPRLSADYSPPPAPYQAPPPAPGAPPPPLPPKTPLPYPDDTSPISPPSAGTQPSPRMGNGPATFMNMGELRRNLPYPVSGAEEGLLRGGGEGPPPSVNMRSKPSLAR